MEETIRLYDRDPYQKECEATLLEEHKRESDGRYEVVLDQTIFYPTGGGQPHDEGWLNKVPVVDVYKRDGVIYHVLESSLSNAVKVKAKIDWDKRFDYMQQHSGQHIISRAFEITYEADTVGFHLGEETVTIDLDIAELTTEMIQSVEELTNKIIFENRPIVKDSVQSSELPEEIVKKIPELEEFVTLVNINDFDSCACSGTHPFYSGEVGLVKILGWEKYKQKVRLTFVCGSRALKTFTDFQQELSDAAAQLKTNRLSVSENIGRMIEEKEKLAVRLKDLATQLISFEVEELKGKAEDQGNLKLIVHIFENRDLNEIKQLSQGITTFSDFVVLFANVTNDKVQFILDRSPELSMNMNECIKVGLMEIEGKGGGNPKTAQGGGQHNGKLTDAIERMKEYLLDK